MDFYDRHVLPLLTDLGCGIKLLREERVRIVPLAKGEVLDVGIGSGLNLPLYDGSRVRRLIGLDPSQALLGYARRRLAKASFPVALIETGAERIPLPSASIDTVVVTFTHCTIPDVETALEEMRQLLKPRGRPLFLEHGLAPDPGVRRWQHRLGPLWGRFAGGCRLDRDVPVLLRNARFTIEDMERRYLPHAPRIVCHTFRGTATRA